MKDFYLLEKFWKEHITARAPHAFLYPKAHVRMRIDPIDVAFEVSVPAFQKPRIVCAAACISFQGLRRPHLLLFRASATPRIRDGRAWTDALPTRCPVRFFHSLASPDVLVLRARAPWQAFRRSCFMRILAGSAFAAHDAVGCFFVWLFHAPAIRNSGERWEWSFLFPFLCKFLC